MSSMIYFVQNKHHLIALKIHKLNPICEIKSEKLRNKREVNLAQHEIEKINSWIPKKEMKKLEKMKNANSINN